MVGGLYFTFRSAVVPLAGVPPAMEARRVVALPTRAPWPTSPCCCGMQLADTGSADENRSALPHGELWSDLRFSGRKGGIRTGRPGRPEGWFTAASRAPVDIGWIKTWVTGIEPIQLPTPGSPAGRQSSGPQKGLVGPNPEPCGPYLSGNVDARAPARRAHHGVRRRTPGIGDVGRRAQRAVAAGHHKR